MNWNKKLPSFLESAKKDRLYTLQITYINQTGKQLFHNTIYKIPSDVICSLFIYESKENFIVGQYGWKQKLPNRILWRFPHEILLSSVNWFRCSSHRHDFHIGLLDTAKLNCLAEGECLTLNLIQTGTAIRPLCWDDRRQHYTQKVTTCVSYQPSHKSKTKNL
jgi:hypothetical protein